MRFLRPALVLTLCASLMAAGAPALAAQPAGLEVRVGQAADFSRIEFHGLQPRSSKREGQDLVLRFATRTLPDIARLRVSPPPYLKTATAKVDGQGLELRLTLTEDGDAQLGKDQGETFVNLKPAPPPPVVAKQDQKTVGRPNPTPLSGKLKVLVEAKGDSLTLRFPWRAPLGASVFRRGEAIWLVFDSPAAIDLSALPRTAAQFTRITPIAGAKVAALRILSPPEITATASAEGGLWTLVLGPKGAAPQAVKLGRDDRSGPMALTANVAGATGVFWLKDPEVGDSIAAVTALAPAKGMPVRRTLVDATLLPTIQGLAVEPMVEDLSVVADGDIVRIGRPRGLALSPQIAKAKKAPPTGLPLPAALPAVIDFVNWPQLGEASFNARYAQLLDLAADEASRGKGAGVQARMGLARFLVGTELSYETIGVLNMVAQADGSMMNDAEFRGLRGAARAMAGRYADAQADFSSPVLAADPSSSLWRAYIAMKLGDAPGARQAYAAGRSALVQFSPKWKARFARAEIDAALQLGDKAGARDALILASAQKLEPLEEQAVALDSARLMEASGQADQALALYDRVSFSSYGALAAPAQQRALEIRLNEGKITPAQAVQGMDSLRYRWRGDATELETIRTLGRIYLSQGRYREALDALRSAGRRLPDLPSAAALQTDLFTAFRNLFLGGAADGLEPVQSLALFYDFKELTPIGAEGDLMVRRLVRRLIDVDLLDQAAELLKYQAENRLDGVPRAEVATDLATLQLMNRQPEAALQAINNSRLTLLPNALNAERRVIEARALMDLGRYDHALEVLGKDASPDARDLKGEIAWKQQAWPVAGQALEAGLGDRWKSKAPLSADEEAQLIRAGAAYSLADDNVSLARLRSRYGRFGTGARQPEAIKVALTGGDSAVGGSAVELARAITDADALAGWVDKMKQRFRDRPSPTAQGVSVKSASANG